ncbi:MAG TPA: BtuF-related (seleno)protein, partial [Gemmataceae bacterium]|nr:BtuF-related (seleno)protein [Gemmataceae bacterium]
DLRAADPDVLIIACCGHSVERTRQDLPLLQALPGWHQLAAVRNRRTYIADGSAYFSRPGPRIVDTLEMLASMLHPQLFEASYPECSLVRVY